MKWHKLWNCPVPPSSDGLLLTHAANPLPLHLKDDIFRVFYSGRNAEGRSSVGYMDLDLNTGDLLGRSSGAVFAHGSDASFYSHGLSIGNIYFTEHGRFMPFMGWQLRPGLHWRGEVGRLRLDTDARLVLDPEHVFMPLDAEDPISLSYPWVMRDKGIYKMWYGSTLDWDAGNGEMIHVIKYATSPDGEVWEKHGIAVPYEVNVAQAFSKPCVVVDANGYHMWYSFRDGKGTTYRIGHAQSADGVVWKRSDEGAGIDVSTEGWDSEMICYPFVFEHAGELYMLYNGNGYGRTGFGLAKFEP